MACVDDSPNLNAFPMVIPDMVMKFQNGIVFEYFVKFFGCRLHRLPCGKR